MEIIIENVRCFYGKTVVPVTPITLLVGENSTGKSTFLAVIAAMTNTNEFPFSAGFNTSPYELGSYENIATRKPQSGSLANSFKIGFKAVRSEKGGERTSIATYIGRHGRAELSEFTITAPSYIIKVENQKRNALVSIENFNDKNTNTNKLEFKLTLSSHQLMNRNLFMSMLLVEMVKSALGTRMVRDNSMLSDLFRILERVAFPFTNVLSIAPIRMKPHRTYDQFNESFEPEGGRVPLKLARLQESNGSNEQSEGEAVKTALERFGQESGLFDSVVIERLGNQPNSPFRVAVHLGGLTVDLVDVGYGVSQSLPIIVESLLTKRGGMLLMQQPEVHLHPKAQAALGTFFASLAKTKRMQFIIETHSDYLVDRVRQEVAGGKIRHQDVTILYFEKKNGRSTIQPITLDKEGNVTNAPDSYRSFFLEEDINLLSRGQ